MANLKNIRVPEKYTLDEAKQFFATTPKNNPRDKIEVEIGDSKDVSSLQPQQKIQRWDNECNISIRLKDFVGFKLETENDKIKLVKPEKEVHFYQVEQGEGCSEFEIILNEKPKSNVIEFSLVDKGVEYFYQPELTQEEKDRGSVRPENVIGSYAVYASENKVNYVGGKEYKCGKVGHIFRPKIIDSVGTEVWGDLHIENGILSVTIPQKFLDKAVYPVRHAAGLTFGYTTDGASHEYFNANSLVGYRFTSPSGSNVAVSISKASFNTGGGSFKGAIVLLSNKNIITNGVTSAQAQATGFSTATFATQPNLSGSTDYILMTISSAYQYVEYDYGTNGYSYVDTSNNYSTPTNPTDATNTTDHKYSIYCTYTAGGSALTKELTEAMTIAEIISKTPALAKAEGMSINESLARTAEYERSLTESLSIAEIIAKAAEIAKVEGMTILDAIATSRGLNLALQDGLTASDTLGKAGELAKTEALTISETIAKTSQLSKTEALTIVETLIKAVGLGKLEGLTIVDSISKIIGVLPSDALTIAETISKTTGKSLSEALTILDSIIAGEGGTLELSDAMTISDALVKDCGIGKAEALTISELIASTFSKALTDAMTISEVLVKSPNINKADALTISETALAKDIGVGISELLTIVETLAKDMQISKTEALTIIDSIATSFGNSLTQALSENLTISDALERTFGKYVAENLTITDSRFATLGKEMLEALTINDLIAKSIELEKGEILTLNTTFETLGQKYKTLSDSVSIVDAIQSQVGFNVLLSDSLTIVETLVKEFGMGLVDALTIIDSLASHETESLQRKTILVTNKNKVILLTTQKSAIIKTNSKRSVLTSNV